MTSLAPLEEQGRDSLVRGSLVFILIIPVNNLSDDLDNWIKRWSLELIGNKFAVLAIRWDKFFSFPTIRLIVELSYRRRVCLSVRPFVRHTPVMRQNQWP